MNITGSADPTRPGGATLPKISAVILTWNRKDDLSLTIAKLRATGYPDLEIIVVDNASTDGTGEMIGSLEFPVKYIRKEKNTGIAGYNDGFRASAGRYIAVFDSDSYPAKNALHRMAARFEADPELYVIAMDVLDTSVDTGSEGGVPEQMPAGNLVYGYHGAGAGFRREAFDRAGYWYDPLFLYCNEQDHAFRLAEHGCKMMFFPDIVAYHKSSRISRPGGIAPFYFARNTLLMMIRHYPAANLAAGLFMLIYHAICASVTQRTGKYILGIVSGFAMAQETFATRRPVSNRTMSLSRVPVRWVFTKFG